MTSTVAFDSRPEGSLVRSDKDARSERGNELLPPEGHKRVGDRVFEILSEIVGDKMRQGLHDKWQEHYRLAKNKPWRASRKNVPLMSANLLHRHRVKTVNVLTDNHPTFNVKKCGNTSLEEDQVLESMQHTAEYWWGETEQQKLFERSVHNGEMYGCSIEKVTFDPFAEIGLGEVKTINVDPFHFGVYPVTISHIQEAEAVFHFYPMTVREVRRRWPEQADRIYPDSEVLKELGDVRRDIVEGPNRKDNILNRLGSMMQYFFSSSDNNTDSDEVLVVEAWVKDYSGDYDEYGMIRRVTVCNAGRTILEDMGNPNINDLLRETGQASLTYLFDKFPFTLVPSIDDTTSIWGMTDWEQLEGLQRSFNKSLSQLEYFKDKAVRPKIVNPRDSGVPNEHFTNDTGIVNPSSADVAAGIRYMDFPNMPVDIEKMISLVRDLFFSIAGSYEVEQAQTGGRNIIAARALQELMEQVSIMIKGKLRNYQLLIRERGRMYISMVQNFYSEDRYIAYDDEGQTEMAVINGHKMLLPVKLTVVSGSTLPRSQVAEREEAIKMYEMGAIDQTELLKRMDWPNRSEVIKRLEMGPNATLFDRLEKVGLPPSVMEVVNELSRMDKKEFDIKLSQKALPSLAYLDPSAPQNPELMEAQASFAKAQAEVDKMRVEMMKISAEYQKILEETITEAAKRRESIEGIADNRRKTDLKAAEIVARQAAEEERTRREMELQKIRESATEGGDDAVQPAQPAQQQGADMQEGGDNATV